MRIIHTLALAGLISLPVLAQAPKVAIDTPVIADGPVHVDAGDVQAYLLRIPEERRGNFMTSYDRIATVADAVFIARVLAEKAKAAGIDKDPVVQRRLQQAQDAVLADLYTQKVQREVKTVNLDQRARELYRAEPEKYKTPELVNLEHILIDLKGRTKEMARDRARDVYAQAQSGKEEFLTLAARFSDDPSKNRNGGALGYSSPASLNPQAREAVANLKAKGDISEPVESDSGFHIFRLVERKPAEVAKFEVVQRNIVEAERDRLQKQRADAVIQDIRSSPTVTTYREPLEALVVPLDPEVLKRAQELHKK
jgi:peptidyl-prolyl cis-trans isomerase C